MDHLAKIEEFISAFGCERMLQCHRKLEQEKEYRQIIAAIEFYIYFSYLRSCYKYLDIEQFYLPQSSDKDTPTTAFLVFFFAFLYSLGFTHKMHDTDDYCYFSAIYVLVDPYLDDPSVTKKDKYKAAEQMKILLEDPRQRFHIPDIHPYLFRATEIYEEGLSKYPLMKPLLVRLLKDQMTGLQVQNRDDFSEIRYREVCARKGPGCFRLILAYIADNEDFDLDKEELFIQQVGTIAQFVDDCCDIKEDTERNINTIATYHYRTYGNIDRLIAECLEGYGRISNRRTVVKFAGLSSVIHAAFTSFDYLSPELQQILKKIEDFYKIFIGDFNNNVTQTFQKHLLLMLKMK